MKKILTSLAVIIVLLAIIVELQPADFRVVRSATISAPTSIVFDQVNDLHKWQEWSPWAKRDPAAKNTFEGPPSGVGASLKWAGNSEVGEGTMIITESRTDELVQFKLEFVRPFKDTSTAEFTFKPEANQTVVTWSMFGQKKFIAKGIGLVMNCDKIVGGDFEKGLENLKVKSEEAAKKWESLK
jgi:hypothetical protein